MDKSEISQEFRSKNIDETINYFIEEAKENEMMSMNHKMLCTTLNYIEHIFTLVSAITGCILIFTLSPLVGISIEITSSAIGIKICAITTGI